MTSVMMSSISVKPDLPDWDRRADPILDANLPPLICSSLPKIAAETQPLKPFGAQEKNTSGKSTVGRKSYFGYADSIVWPPGGSDKLPKCF